LDGFSWQDPFVDSKRETSHGSASSSAGPAPPPPPPPPHSTMYAPHGRTSSHGSMGMAIPHHTSIGGPPPPDYYGGPPPPPPDYYGRVASDGRREYSLSRYESWGNLPFPAYPPLPPPAVHGPPMHIRSGSWTHAPPLPLPPHGGHQRSGSWTAMGGREHSLSHNPLANASIAHTASQGAFDSSRSGSGYWGERVGSMGSMGPAIPPPPPGPYGSGGQPYMNGSSGPYRESSNSVSPHRSPNNSTTPPSTSTPAGSYNVDLNIAKSWSGGEVRQAWSGDEEIRRSWSREEYEQQHLPENNNSPLRTSGGSPNQMPKPHIVKRDTSNQNENYETKPSIKRAALNRDNSLASNRLKEQYMPEFYNGKFDTDREMRMLSDNLEETNLRSPDGEPLRPKPKSLMGGDRLR
jgi:hypothetical protein